MTWTNDYEVHALGRAVEAQYMKYCLLWLALPCLGSILHYAKGFFSVQHGVKGFLLLRLLMVMPDGCRQAHGLCSWYCRHTVLHNITSLTSYGGRERFASSHAGLCRRRNGQCTGMYFVTCLLNYEQVGILSFLFSAVFRFILIVCVTIVIDALHVYFDNLLRWIAIFTKG